MKKIFFLLTLTVLISELSYSQTSPKEIKFGGRIMYDMAIWGDSAMDNSGTEFRRVRFYNSGKLYGNVKYKLQLDFAGGTISFKDVWMELSELPFNGNIRVGHFKEPLRLEALTSSKYITFIERGLPISMSPCNIRTNNSISCTIKLMYQIACFSKYPFLVSLTLISRTQL